MNEWQPIDTCPEGENVLLFFPEGERGIPAIETTIVYRSADGLSFWTEGGPNSGSDWEPNSQPTHWMPLPDPPTGRRRRVETMTREDARLYLKVFEVAWSEGQADEDSFELGRRLRDSYFPGTLEYIFEGYAEQHKKPEKRRSKTASRGSGY